MVQRSDWERRIEARLGRLRLAVLVLLLVLTVGLVTAFKRPQVTSLEVSELLLRDDAGKIRARLGFDAAGSPVLHFFGRETADTLTTESNFVAAAGAAFGLELVDDGFIWLESAVEPARRAEFYGGMLVVEGPLGNASLDLTEFASPVGLQVARADGPSAVLP